MNLAPGDGDATNGERVKQKRVDVFLGCHMFSFVDTQPGDNPFLSVLNCGV